MVKRPTKSVTTKNSQPWLVNSQFTRIIVLIKFKYSQLYLLPSIKLSDREPTLSHRFFRSRHKNPLTGFSGSSPPHIPSGRAEQSEANAQIFLAEAPVGATAHGLPSGRQSTSQVGSHANCGCAPHIPICCTSTYELVLFQKLELLYGFVF
jgi:hypothetical protein